MKRTELEAGTHVSVLTIWGCRHHGIVGEDGTIYQNDIRTGKGGFRLSTVDAFYKDAIPGTERKETQRYSNAEVLRRAKEKASWGEQLYHLTLNNCEHDAREVAEGVRRSDQVNNLAFLYGFMPGMIASMMMQVGADMISGRSTNVNRFSR